MNEDLKKKNQKGQTQFENVDVTQFHTVYGYVKAIDNDMLYQMYRELLVQLRSLQTRKEKKKKPRSVFFLFPR